MWKHLLNHYNHIFLKYYVFSLRLQLLYFLCFCKNSKTFHFPLQPITFSPATYIHFKHVTIYEETVCNAKQYNFCTLLRVHQT